MTYSLVYDILISESEGTAMEYEGKKWCLIDDPICDLEEWQSVPVDCRECELFYDCYEIDSDN